MKKYVSQEINARKMKTCKGYNKFKVQFIFTTKEILV